MGKKVLELGFDLLAHKHENEPDNLKTSPQDYIISAVEKSH